MSNILEWIGYIGSIIIFVSLLMNSIIKLRLINLLGSLMFSFYGFAIGSLPTGIMNLGISFINLYYLFIIYNKKEYMRILPITKEDDFLNAFLRFHIKDINNFFNVEIDKLKKAEIKFLILRDMNPAGVFICEKVEEHVYNIKVDYVIPRYRDFKSGMYLFQSQVDYFKASNIKKLISKAFNKKHAAYLKKIGFKKTNSNSIFDYYKEIWFSL